MKVMGLTRNRNYHGRWEMLFQKCSDCHDVLLKIAGKRKRNLILDQTNVYPAARARKIRDFAGYDCKSIVVIPNDAEFQRRAQARAVEEGKEVPQEAILSMKANFALPDIEEKFSDIFYTDLGPAEAAKLIEQYHQEAFNAGSSMNKATREFLKRNEKKRREQGIFNQPGKLFQATAQTSADSSSAAEGISNPQPQGVKRPHEGQSSGPTPAKNTRFELPTPVPSAARPNFQNSRPPGNFGPPGLSRPLRPTLPYGYPSHWHPGQYQQRPWMGPRPPYPNYRPR